MPEVTGQITGENQFIDPIKIAAGVPGEFDRLDLSIFGTFVATVSIQRSFNGGVITAVADGGGGEIDLTVSEPHLLQVGNVIAITGTTDYNGTFTIVGIPTSTVFSVTNTFVDTQTGAFTGPWLDVETRISPVELVAESIEAITEWRMGVKTGDFTSGTVELRMGY